MRTDGLKAGDVVYGSFGRYGAVDVKAGGVLKVTPSGQISVDFKEKWSGNGTPRLRRFNRNGHAIGDSEGFLIDQETFARLFERQKATAARDAVTAHLRSWSFRNKAELNALVARLNELAARVPDDESVAPVDTLPEGRDAEERLGAEQG